MRPFDAVLFDLGGVYTDSPFAAFDGIAAELGSTPETVQEILFGQYDTDGDHPWHRLERGEITLTCAREDIMALGRARDLEIDPIQLLSRIGSGKGTRDPLIERTRALRHEGYKTALVTNNFVEVREAWRKLLPVDDLFDAVVDSSEIGVRKPDAAIYRHALDLLETRPERAIFLDDFPGNVLAARDLGMQGVIVGADVGAAIAELDELLSGGAPSGTPSAPER